MGRNLGLDIVAEGVESREQANVLEHLCCPLVQGFLYDRPLASDQVGSRFA